MLEAMKEQARRLHRVRLPQPRHVRPVQPGRPGGELRPRPPLPPRRPTRHPPLTTIDPQSTFASRYSGAGAAKVATQTWIGARRSYSGSPRRMGRVVRHSPSRSWSAAATAGAVGTRPISPTPLMPNGDRGWGTSTIVHLHRRHVLGPQDAERTQRHVRREAGLGIGREVLAQRVPEAHVDAAFDLALDEHRVDRLADVVDGDDLVDAHRSRDRSRPSGRRS